MGASGPQSSAARNGGGQDWLPYRLDSLQVDDCFEMVGLRE